MNWLVYHIVSGHSFFTGLILLVIAAFASISSRPAFHRISFLSFIIGIIAVVVSSTAIPDWFYAAAILVTITWIVSFYKQSWRPWTAYAMVSLCLVATILESPYHFLPSLNRAPDRRIAIIGDSVTAGVDGDETAETWPSILARENQLEVQDISHIGETAASALKRAKSYEITASLVIVEIGGNDILGSTTPKQFAIDLEALLSHLTTDDRQVVMFELPLPPFFHEYGRIQRTLAARYNVSLIPKRIFLSVIAGDDSTLDSIHLSQSGHQLMADQVWRIVRSAFDDPKE